MLVGERRKASDALPPARRAPVPPGRWEGVGSLPTAAHRPGGTPPSEGGVPPPRWAEPNYPSVINKPAATRPDASDNSMTEATSMMEGSSGWRCGPFVLILPPHTSPTPCGNISPKYQENLIMTNII